MRRHSEAFSAPSTLSAVFDSRKSTLGKKTVRFSDSHNEILLEGEWSQNVYEKKHNDLYIRRLMGKMVTEKEAEIEHHRTAAFRAYGVRVNADGTSRISLIEKWKHSKFMREQRRKNLQLQKVHGWEL